MQINVYVCDSLYSKLEPANFFPQPKKFSALNSEIQTLQSKHLTIKKIEKINIVYINLRDNNVLITAEVHFKDTKDILAGIWSNSAENWSLGLLQENDK